MKYITYICSILLFMNYACNPQGNKGLRIKKASTFLLGKQDRDSVIWCLRQTFDPYDGGQLNKRDPANPKYLVLRRDGKYKQIDNLNRVIGNWHLNREKNALAFVVQSRNGNEVEKKADQALNFRHQIRKHTSDTMILAWQGRHGFVEELYTAWNDSIQPPEIINRP